MRQGKNVAEEIKNEPYRRYLYDQSSKSSGLCFFISHKNEDADAALEIGNHIMNDFGYNIYLDLFDEALQVADQNNDVETIVKSIHNGLKYSTHLLCVAPRNLRNRGGSHTKLDLLKQTIKRPHR